MDLTNTLEHGLCEDEFLFMLYGIMNVHVTLFNILCLVYLRLQPSVLHNHARANGHSYSLVNRVPRRLDHLHRVLGVSDIECINQLRMSCDAFSRLCTLLENCGGLRGNRNSSISEKVAVFLSILSHHTKVRVVKSAFTRSGRTVSRHFHDVLNAIIRLHSILLVNPQPIDDACTDNRWSCFKGCLGALDGTYVSATVPKAQRGSYRNRKGEITVNVLGVCDPNINFVYVLSGWEGSAADSRVLRDALIRPNGLRIPRGLLLSLRCYYICYSSYANCEGFLTPYRGARYHLREWGLGTNALQTREEYFNMKHSKARNVIERSFGVLKKRWAILRSTSFYPIRVQNQIIMVCFLLHNFIRQNMGSDPAEDDFPDDYGDEDEEDGDYIDTVEASQMWSNWRDTLASDMYNRWRN